MVLTQLPLATQFTQLIRIERLINYSTKEMRITNQINNGVDTFEQTYFSWKDFPQSPINKRTPKKIKKLDTKMRPKVGALDKFMS